MGGDHTHGFTAVYARIAKCGLIYVDLNLSFRELDVT